MIDADVVTVDVRVFRAICQKVAAGARKGRQRKRIDIGECKLRKAAAARTVTQIVTGNRRSVRREDRSARCDHRAAAGQLISYRIIRLQEFAKVADAHSRCRHRHRRIWIAGAAEDRRGISLTIQRVEKERTIAAIVKSRSAFTRSRQEDWTTDSAVEVVRNVVRHWQRTRIVKSARSGAEKTALVDLADGSMNVVATGLERRRDDATAGAS